MTNDQMKISIEIPGWNSREILEYLAAAASNVAHGGKILELGALFGRTTYVLGHNKHPSVSLTTVDIWPTILLNNRELPTIHDGRCSLENVELIKSKYTEDGKYFPGKEFHALWKHFTAGIENLESFRERSPIKDRDWPMFDLIVHDASHDYPDVYMDLEFWFPFLKHDGELIVDDYDAQFPGVIQSVDQYVKDYDLSTTMVTNRNIKIRRK